MLAVVNLAKGKPTFQSSTSSDGVSARAVDGNRDANYYAGSCIHTQTIDHRGPHWWAVDLGALYYVDSVLIVNRKDCCGMQFLPFHLYEIFVIFSPPSFVSVHLKPLFSFTFFFDVPSIVYRGKEYKKILGGGYEKISITFVLCAGQCACKMPTGKEKCQRIEGCFSL